MQCPILFTYWRQYFSLWRQHWRTFHFIKTAWFSVAYSTVRVCERWRWTFWTPCRPKRDCFADCSLDLTLIVFFWKIAFLVCCWKQIIISWSRDWTHLQFSTQCSNGCQCVLCNFQWFLFSIMSATFFGTHCIVQVPSRYKKMSIDWFYALTVVRRAYFRLQRCTMRTLTCGRIAVDCFVTLLVGWSLVGHIRELWLNGEPNAYSYYWTMAPISTPLAWQLTLDLDHTFGNHCDSALWQFKFGRCMNHGKY